MNARQWESPDKLFDVFTSLTYSPTDSKDVTIDSIIPSHYDTQDILNQIPKFSYPCKYDSPGVEHYTFVLTDVEAKFHYGFCRFSHDQHHIICLLSRLPWFDVFYLLLNKISDVSIGVNGESQVQLLLEAVYNTKVPSPSEPCVILGSTPLEFSFDTPDTDKLASIPTNRNLTVYYSAIDADMMINVFSCLLNERRILITSKKLGKLTACCHAAASLLYPCYWQHLFIPVLPEAVLEFVLAPMPYIIGVHESLMGRVQTMDLDDAVILNIDTGTMTTSHDDRSLLPSDAVSSLKKSLKSLAQDDSVARGFLRCLVIVIGGYKDGLKIQEDTVEFDEDEYIGAASSSGEKAWREVVVRMQYFSQFIDDRLAILNSGKGFEDQFEVEMVKHFDDKGNTTKYKEWVTNMRKQGKKIKNKGQHTFIDISKKVQDKTKKTYKDIKNRLDERLKKDYSIIDKGNSHYMVRGGSDKNLAAPRTIAAAPMKPTRFQDMFSEPPRPLNAKDQPSNDLKAQISPKRQSYNKALKYRTLSFSEEDFPSPGASDLLNDPDIQSVLQRKSQSTANLQFNSDLISTGSADSQSISNSSNTLHPVPPPRRKRSDQISNLSSAEDVNKAGQANEAFADNFNPIIPDSSSTSAFSHLSLGSTPAATDTDLLLDTSTNSTVIVQGMTDTPSVTNSNMDDLLGLDLSPTKPVNPITEPNANLWNQNKPNYYVSTNHQSTNPFVGGFSAPSPFTMTNSSSSPSLSSMAQSNGQVPTTYAPMIPTRPPRPFHSSTNSQPSKDPLAELKWQ